MNRKAQGATEYLIILAIVIIIGLIVVGAMGGIPGIGAAGKTRTSATFWSSAEVGVTVFGASPLAALNPSLNVTLRNNLRNSIVLQSGAANLNVVSNGVTYGLTCLQYTLFPGQQTKCYYKGAVCTTGTSYSFDVLITYQESDTKKIYAFNGNGQKLEGRCSTS